MSDCHLYLAIPRQGDMSPVTCHLSPVTCHLYLAIPRQRALKNYVDRTITVHTKFTNGLLSSVNKWQAAGHPQDFEGRSLYGGDEVDGESILATPYTGTTLCNVH